MRRLPGSATALSTACFRLGQIIGAGLLDQAEIEQSLLQAGVSVGLGEREVARTVEHIDVERGDARIDFATWGRLELSVTQMLSAGIAHDYVGDEPGLAVEQVDVVERLLVEASRIEPGVSW